MEMHQIRYFLAVERARNFSRAAQQCNITQPALTRAIQKLEDEIGGKLFFRRPGLIELTELGRAMLPRLQAAYREVAEARSEAASLMRQMKQRLRLGVMCTIGPDRVSGLIGVLRTAIPELDLTLKDATARDVLGLLATDEVDAALVALPAYPDTCDAVALYRERYVLAMPANHGFAANCEVAVGDLAGIDYIERTNCEFDEHFAAAHGEWPVELNVRHRCGREDWVQAMVRSGLGVAILPESFPLLRGVVTAPLAAPEMSREISLVTHKTREPPAVLDTLRSVFTAHDWH